MAPLGAGAVQRAGEGLTPSSFPRKALASGVSVPLAAADTAGPLSRVLALHRSSVVGRDLTGSGVDPLGPVPGSISSSAVPAPGLPRPLPARGWQGCRAAPAGTRFAGRSLLPPAGSSRGRSSPGTKFHPPAAAPGGRVLRQQLRPRGWEFLCLAASTRCRSAVPQQAQACRVPWAPGRRAERRPKQRWGV